MATKNFDEMTTEKLIALKASANKKDLKAIEAILAARAAEPTSEPVAEPVAEPTSEPVAEPTAEPAAETTSESTAEPAAETTSAPESAKMTDEELETLAESLKQNIHKKCEVVPFNTIEWVSGYIAGVLIEKRARKVLYVIKSDDGKRLVKMHNSPMLKIFDEMVEVTRAVRTLRPEPITDEKLNELLETGIKNVGKLLTFSNGTTDVYTRIIAVQADKRHNTPLYRLKGLNIEGNEPFANNIYYKVIGNNNYSIAESFDEEGEKLNNAYIERRDKAANKVAATPQELVTKLEQELVKLNERRDKIEADIEAKKRQLETAKLAVENELNDDLA